MQLRRRTKSVIVVVAVALLAGLLFSKPWEWTLGKPALRIDRQTTRITGPLAADGRVDYIAAMNAKYSQGVTPDNNVAVLLAKAFGPQSINVKDRTSYYRGLGIDPLPDQGSYFQHDYDFGQSLYRAGELSKREMEVVDEMFNAAEQRPWNEAEFPLVARWLDANEISLNLIVAASERPRFFEPVIGETVLSANFPALVHIRSAAQAISSRVMLRVSRGETSAAIEDVLAKLKLARLLQHQMRCAGGELMGNGLYNHALSDVARLSFYAPLSAAQCRAIQAALINNPQPLGVNDRLDTDERWVPLESLQSVAFAQSAGTRSVSQDSWLKELPVQATDVDWNVTMIQVNDWRDRLVDAMRVPGRTERRAALQTLDDELKRTYEAKSPSNAVSRWLMSRAERSEWIGVLISLGMFKALTSIDDVRSSTTVRENLTQIAVALACHRADRGAFPERLSELSPSYLTVVPKDLFGGGEFHYQRTKLGYRLYSNGKNEIDDGGKPSNCDDIVYELPVPPRETADTPPTDVNTPETAPTDNTP